MVTWMGISTPGNTGLRVEKMRNKVSSRPGVGSAVESRHPSEGYKRNHEDTIRGWAKEVGSENVE